MASDSRDVPSGTAGRKTEPGGALRARLAQELNGPAVRPALPSIPDHTLLRHIGEGACGEVWLARSALGTLRAVKIVFRARFKEDRPYEREFGGILKYEPVSRTHEGLVQVLHVGRNDKAGCFYYVMELADAVDPPDAQQERKLSNDRQRQLPAGKGGALSPGNYSPRTLRSELARHPRLPPGVAAKLGLRLAQALGHLHDHGLVHRDIKPSNVIFVAGQPKLADIGLVTDVGSSHSFVGTEGFIPPEGPGTPQADLYALGKLLYELAAGCDRLDFPRLPPDISRWSDSEAYLELNEIMSRACAPEPRARYSSATEIQAELDLFLAGRSLRRARNVERALERVKRFAAGACVLLAVVAAALWFSKREELQALQRADTETALRRRAEAAEQESRNKLYAALLEQARATVRSADLGQRARAIDAIRQAAAITNSVELRREALAALTLPDMRSQKELPIGSDFTVRTLDPQFERIALCRGRGPVEIRSVLNYRLLATLPASTNLACFGVTWSKDGRYLAVKRDHPPSGQLGDLEVWETGEPRLVALLKQVLCDARAFHPEKAELLSGFAAGSVAAWDLEQGKELWRSHFAIEPESLAYSPDGNRLVASSRMTNHWAVSILHAADGAILSSRVFTNRVSSLAWHPGGCWVAIADYGGGVHLLDSQSGELRALGRHKAEAATVLFSPRGDYLLSGGWERELVCWDARTMQRAMTISLDSYIAQFRTDGEMCALFTPSGVQLHTFDFPKVNRRFAEELGPRLRHAAFSPDGKWLAAAADGRVGMWALDQTSPGAVTEGGADTQLLWTHDGKELFGSSRSQSAFRWRIAAGLHAAERPVLQPLELPLPDGFVSLNVMSNRIVWTAAKGGRTAPMQAGEGVEQDWVNGTIAGTTGISPDQRWLGVFRPYGNILHVYRLPELEPVTQLTNQAAIAGFSFSPSSDEVGVASRGQVEFWRTSDWERTRAAAGFIGIMDVGMLFHPDMSAVWLAKDYRTSGLYDPQTLQPWFFLPTGLLPLALSPDGRHLAVSVDAQWLEVWDLAAVRQAFQELGLDW